MELDFDRLRRYFDTLKNIGFFQRLFGWNKIKSDLIDANGDLQRLISALEILRTENSKLENLIAIEQSSLKNVQESSQRFTTENSVLKESNSTLTRQNEDRLKELTTLTEANRNFSRRAQELSNDLAVTKQKMESLEAELQKVRSENGQLLKTEEFRMKEHSNALSTFVQIQENLQKERAKEIDERNKAEVERIKKLKETWSNHEENVKNRIKTICSKHTIDYVDKVPFKGNPDNTLKINNEYVIFDAKSPGGEDLSNFPSYLKIQAESAIKYAKEEDVKRDIFLVVPTNTLENIEYFEYRLADYTVYVVSLDSLEPVILTLQKIEQYEFADQLSPEERENICRVIGKFLHLSKRRIQIDGFFAKQFFELVYRSEAELPKEILEKVIEFEKSEKLNPPTEKRAKQINLRELETDSDKLKSEANQKGIVTQDSLLSKELNKLPLYLTQIENPGNDDQGKLFDD